MAGTPSGDRPKRVLVLDSFGPDFEPYHAVSSQFRAQLAERWPHPIDLHVASVETPLFGESAAEDPFLDYLVALYGKRPPDLVVPIGGPAVRFVQRDRRQLFGATPVLLAGASKHLLDQSRLADNDTAVAVELDLPGFTANILKVMPDTTQLFVVLGASALERYWQRGSLPRARSLGALPLADHWRCLAGHRPSPADPRPAGQWHETATSGKAPARERGAPCLGCGRCRHLVVQETALASIPLPGPAALPSALLV